MRTERALLLFVSFLAGVAASAEPVAVRFKEGLVHGFLALRTMDGKTLAHGDLLQVARGGKVTSRLVFHFEDGSVFDEKTVFAQAGHFKLLRSRLVQKGPSFPQPLEATIDGASGRVVVKTKDDGGKAQKIEKTLELPEDLANGLILTMLKNISPQVPRTKVSLVVFMPKPMLVKLEIEPRGEETFTIAGDSRSATYYVIKVDIPGLMGIFASLLGKNPPDSHVWILGGEAPAFVKSESPFYKNAPLWRIELESPEWPKGGDRP